jgi:hypothetical protein
LIEERFLPKVPRQVVALKTLPTGQPLIRRAVPSDAEKLGVIGPAAYSSAYSYLWNNSVELGKHLDTFSAAAFAELLSRTDARVWVAQIDRSLVGFLSMIVGSPNPISLEPSSATARPSGTGCIAIRAGAIRH